MHPIIHGTHILTKLIILSEHQRLLHAGPTLVSSPISRRYHILGMRKTIRSVTRQCIVCRRRSTTPIPQMMGQLPIERVTPGTEFEKAMPVQYRSSMGRLGSL